MKNLSHDLTYREYKQLETENSLEHTIYNGIQGEFIIDNSREYFYVDFEIFGHCFKLNFTSSHTKKNQIKMGNCFFVLPQYESVIINSNVKYSGFPENRTFSIDRIPGIYFFHKEDRREGLNNFISLLNIRTEYTLEKLNKIFRRKIKLILADDYFNSLAVSFLENYGSDFYCEPDLLTVLELFIENEDQIFNTSLISNPDQRENLVTKTKKNNEFSYTLKNAGKIEAFYTDFEKLSILIKKYFVKNDKSSYFFDKEDIFYKYLTHILLCKKAPEFYSSNWIKEFGEITKNNTNLKEISKSFCEIPEIFPNDSKTIGKFIYYLIYTNPKFKNYNFLTFFDLFKQQIENFLDEENLNNFEKKLLNKQTQNKISTIEEIDLMNGIEFENFLCNYFSSIGFRVESTKISGDQGIDIIAIKNDKKIGIQAKCYSGKVSNKAIQEVVAGIAFYSCDKGMVITNSTFTDSAINLAEINGIVLWDREMLIRKIDNKY